MFGTGENASWVIYGVGPNWVNVIKFIVINVILLPIVELAIAAWFRRWASFRILSGKPIYWKESKMGLLGLHGKHFSTLSALALATLAIAVNSAAFFLEFGVSFSEVRGTSYKNVSSINRNIDLTVITTSREAYWSVQHVNSELFDISRNSLEDYQLTYTDDRSSREVVRLTEEDYINKARSKLATIIANKTELFKFLQSHRSYAARTPKMLDDFIRARGEKGVVFKERKQVRSVVSREWCLSRDGSARKCVCKKNLNNMVANTTQARVPIGGVSGVQNTLPPPAVAGLAINRREDFEQLSVIERAYIRPRQEGEDCQSSGQSCGYDYVNSLAYLPLWYTEHGFCHEPWPSNDLGLCYQLGSDRVGKVFLHVYFAELNTRSTFKERFGKMSGVSVPGVAEYGVSHWVGDVLSMRLDDESSSMSIGELVSNFRLLAVMHRFKFYKALGAAVVAVDGDAMTITAQVYAALAMRGGLLDPNITVRAEAYSKDERIPITTVQNYVVWMCAAIMGFATSYLAFDKLVAKFFADVVWDPEAVNTSSRGSWVKCVFSLSVGDNFDYAVRKFNDDQHGTGICHSPKETSLKLGLDKNGGEIRHLGFREWSENDSDAPAFRTHQVLK